MPITQPWQTVVMAEDATPEVATIDINTTTGSFVSKNPNGTWASLWKSTQSSPYFNLGCGANNMDVNNSTMVRLLLMWATKPIRAIIH